MPKFSWADQEHAERMKAWFLELPHVVGLAPLSLFRPSSSSIAYALQRGQRLGYNHQYVGSTQLAPPLPSSAFACKPKKLRPGWRIDHVRKKIGHGRSAYDRAVKAVMSWKQMELGWTTVQAESPKKGALVCVLPHVTAIWMRLPLQVAFVSEGQCKSGRKMAVAHSTLQGHALAGEERFSIEWHKQDDSVWYDLYTVSKPATPVAVLSYPIIRLLQKRFQKDTFLAMERAVE